MTRTTAMTTRAMQMATSRSRNNTHPTPIPAIPAGPRVGGDWGGGPGQWRGSSERLGGEVSELVCLV